MQRSILVLVVLFAAGTSHAELATNAGGWLMGLGRGSLERVSPRLDRVHWWLDVQLRLRDDTSGFQQAVVRPGLGVAVTERVGLYAGYAWVRTARTKANDSDEHRIWQQLIWSPRFEPVSIQLRTRLEQRFLSTGDDTGWRFRQFVKLGRAFSFEPRASLVGYEEVFFDLNDTDWGQDAGFAQNRLFAGLAWRFDAGGRVVGELGYLNQFIDNRTGRDTMNHLVSFNLLFN